MRFRWMFCLALLSVPIAAQYATPPNNHYVTVNGAGLQSAHGWKESGKIAFAPVDANGRKVAFMVPGEGQITTEPVSVTLTNGAFSVVLPDTSQTVPANICFAVSISTPRNDSIGPGYACVQPHGTAVSGSDWCQAGVCDFDNYIPNTSPAIPVLYKGNPPVVALTDAESVIIPVSGGFSSFVDLLSGTILQRTLNASGLATNDVFEVTFISPYSTAHPIIASYISWSANTAVTLGQAFFDPNGHLQIVITAGTTGASAPAWNDSGQTTLDSGAKWLDLGPPLTIAFGSGCTWQAATGASISPLPSSIVIAPGSGDAYTLSVSYDGTHCNVSE